jgi:8-amino-7-oxononanoate synthase
VPTLDDELHRELATLDAATLRRRLRPLGDPPEAETSVAGRRVLLCSSNNYLGLATHPAVVEAAMQATRRWGCSAGASRLIAGHLELHEAAERRIATFEETEAALLFPTGYQANIGAVTALVGRGDHVFSDALNHASIIDGCRLSRARVHVYPHADLVALERALADAPSGGRRLIVTDSVFSMDGDRAPLAELVALARHYHSLVMIDEAHATGVLGPRGAGLADACGLRSELAVTVGTLGKALGSQGAYVAGSRALVDVVVNRARTFVFTTGLQPAAVAAACAALDLVEAEPARRTRLLAHAARLRAALSAIGFDVAGDTHILPVMVGDNDAAVALGNALLAEGVLVQPIRPPTVRSGTARLRVTPMATHTRAQIDHVAAAFARVTASPHRRRA